MDSLTFSYSSDGSVLVSSDGPELFAYYGGDGSPAWSVFLNRPLESLAIVGQEVLGLDDRGTLTSWNAQDGGVLWTSELGQTTGRLAVSSARSIAISDGTTLRIYRADGSSSVLETDGLTSFGWCGEEVLVGTSHGEVKSQAGTGWKLLASLSGPVRELCAAGPGRWAAGGDSYVAVGSLTADTPTFVSRVAGCQDLAVALDGGVVAVYTGDGEVLVVDGYAGELAGHVRVKRPVAGIGFGPERLLGVGLDDGDASQVDIASSEVIHTTAHAGRAKRAWHVTVQMQASVLRGARAMHVTKGASVATYTGVRPEEDKPSRFRWWMGLVGLFFLIGLGGLALLMISGAVLWLRGLS